MRAIRIEQPGGPEVMRLEEVEPPPPGKGEVRLRHHAIGVNFIDIYYRSGFYPPATTPFTPGNEGAGEIVAVGPGVKGFKPGDRVAYAGSPGAYAEERNVEARFLFKLPKSISYDTAAAMMLKGLTAQYLLRQTYRVKEGDTILVHAAAGGVGLILCQWGKALGATVIGSSARRKRPRSPRRRAQAHHPLSRGGFRQAGRRDHQGREMPRGLRRGRQGDLPRLARLPEAVRGVRELWLGLRRRSRRSTSGFWRRRARCSRPGRPSPPSWRTARGPRKWRATCSAS